MFRFATTVKISSICISSPRLASSPFNAFLLVHCWFWYFRFANPQIEEVDQVQEHKPTQKLYLNFDSHVWVFSLFRITCQGDMEYRVHLPSFSTVHMLGIMLPHSSASVATAIRFIGIRVSMLCESSSVWLTISGSWGVRRGADPLWSHSHHCWLVKLAIWP